MNSLSATSSRRAFQRFVERSVTQCEGIATGAIQRVDIRASPYRTSFPIYEIDVRLQHGDSINLLCKDLSWKSLRPGAAVAKPIQLHQPLREIEVYRRILRADLGTARLYGAEADETANRYWLLIEHVPGVELYQVGDLKGWCRAAAWFSSFHDVYQWVPESTLVKDASLLVHTPALWSEWIDRAIAIGRASTDAAFRGCMDQLAAARRFILDILQSLPPRFIHGDAYASNILIGVDGAARVCPVDWEAASVGPALLDLAALTAGWDDPAADRIADSYAEAQPADSVWRSDPASFRSALDACRTLVAVRWLGSAPDWRPPSDNHTDWTESAHRAMERLRP